MLLPRCLALFVGLVTTASAAAAAAEETPPGASELRCDAAGCALGPCLTRALFNNPASEMRHVRLVPQVTDGQPRGFRLYALRAESMLAKLGLQNGDLVVDVNGQSISTPDLAFRVSAELRSATHVELGVERKGQRLVRMVTLDWSPVTPEQCPPPPPPPAAPPPPPQPPRERPEQLLRSLARDIVCKKLHCTVRSDVVDRILANTTQLTTSARIVTMVRDGKVDGFQLVLTQPESIFSIIGLRSHDLVRRVNGYELASPEKALEAYAKLRDARELTVDLERGGKPMQLHYTIVP